jgi:PmbA protein
MANDSLQDVARACVKAALAVGAGDAAATTRRSRHVTVEWRDGRIERINEATTRNVTLQLYVDGRYSQASSSDLRPEGLETFIADSVVMTRALAPDPFRSLPDPALYKGQAGIDLELEDPGHASLSAPERRETALALEEAARSVKGADKILSVSTGVDDSRTESFRAASNGFEGERVDTTFSHWAEASVQDPDGRRPQDWAAATTHHRAELTAAKKVGRRAAERALARVGSQKAASGVMTLIVDNRAAGRLVAALLGPLSGSVLQQKRSFLEARMGKTLGSPLLDLTDDPLLPRGLGSRLFDGEGLAARRLPLFEKGVLRNFYLDTYYAKKLEMAPTTGRTSNLAWSLGAKSQAELLRDAGEAILVTGFLGGNSNTTTGDFSLGIQGFRVRNGALGEPVAEMNISGNLAELLGRLRAVGNDPYPFSALRTPTLVFEKVQFAGV